VRDRESVQHTDGLAAGDGFVRLAGISDRPLGHERDDGVDLRVYALDLRQMCGHDLAR
jgi:hypothetical protein